ncbi:acyltransferase family protein [Pedobacter sp. GSP4]|uniref:acyltransferase family protein n=1 Tax=Pedobacter sp. GSP4 TaxID=3453716 RepID=UPI003EEEFC60
MDKKVQSIQWLKGLDSLRFILALVVLLSHIFTHPDFQLVPNTEISSIIYTFIRLISNGTAAVIGFFILSGFIIHYTSKLQVTQLKKFYARRFIRILGPLAVVFLLGYRFGHPEKGVVWSLLCELIFYALYPFTQKIKLNWNSKLLISFLGSLIAIYFFAYHDILAMVNQSANHYHGYYWQAGPLYTWIIGLPCWLFGVKIAEDIHSDNQTSFKVVYLYRISVLICSVLLHFLKEEYFVSYILSMNFFAILSYYWLKNEIIYSKYNKTMRFMEQLGKSSYSLYIFHPLIILLIHKLIQINNLTSMLMVITAIILSYIFYLLIEKPFHHFARFIGNKFNQ